MPYTAVPDHRIPYDNDGTVVVASAGSYSAGPSLYPSGAQLIALNGRALVSTGWSAISGAGAYGVWWFFPEQREVTAGILIALDVGGNTVFAVEGSNDSTNGLDGSWETATITGTMPRQAETFMDAWRKNICAVSFTGGKRTIRIRGVKSGVEATYANIHWYGEKVAGQTPSDLVYIDHDTTPGVEFASVEDFGDRPLGTSVTRQFRLKNTSTSLTANAINVQCNDTDFAISTDGTTWVVTINIASLAPGAESSTMYVRNTTPAAGAALGPRFARLVTIVGSWT